MKEEALKKSELMLEEDAMRFDAFLKENDRKAHEALKRADHETKEKQEKVAQIKKLNQEIAMVENEMSQYEEQLSAFLKYKDFLDKLTPPEHFARLKEKKEKRRAARRAAKGLTEEKTANDDDDSDDDVDLDEMYFQRPEQLLEIFAQLEERNLFLIQNVQQTEEALEELKQKFQETKVCVLLINWQCFSTVNCHLSPFSVFCSRVHPQGEHGGENQPVTDQHQGPQAKNQRRKRKSRGPSHASPC